MLINDQIVSIPEAWQDATLLEFLRDHAGLPGAKYGCGVGLCGACTVHLDGVAVRACVIPVAAVGDREVRTIEGLGQVGRLHPVQQAWKELSVPQCGYCQPGQMMTAAALLASQPEPSPAEIAQAMDGNLCRCGTYVRIRTAVQRAVELSRQAR
jgi:isoquinoline 1-oxidoreductase alpha subunit